MLTEDNLRMCYGLPSKQEVVEFVDFLKKGKAAPIGEVRIWSGQQYVKHADGWVHIHPTTGKVSVLPTSGPIRRFDGDDEHWAHFLKHTQPQIETKPKDGTLLSETQVRARVSQEAPKIKMETLHYRERLIRQKDATQNQEKPQKEEPDQEKTAKERLEQVYASKVRKDTNKLKGSILYRHSSGEESLGKTASEQYVFKNRPAYKYPLFDSKDHQDARDIHLKGAIEAEKQIPLATTDDEKENLTYRAEAHRNMAHTHDMLTDNYKDKEPDENRQVSSNTLMSQKDRKEPSKDDYYFDKDKPKLNQHYGKGYLNLVHQKTV